MSLFKRLLTLLSRESSPVASVDEMKREMTHLMAEMKNSYDQIAQLRHENEELKQEVKRLRA